MNAHFQPNLNFEAVASAVEDGEALVVDIEGYEGPLHVLLALARSQKVDLLQLSITRLADQYLAFVREARRRRFSLAADYLVMAAWLAYLKSRLLLPKPEKLKEDERPAEEVAAQLAFRLAKLDVMRSAVESLKARPQLRRDVFTRGDPDAVKIVSQHRLEGDLYALMTAYIGQRKRRPRAATGPMCPSPTRWRTRASACAACCPNWRAGPRCKASRRPSGAPDPAGRAIWPRPFRPAWNW